MLRPGRQVTHKLVRRFDGWSGRRGARGFAVLLICAGLALTLGVAALFAASGPSFARVRSYATGSGPSSVAIGDLNGDGKPDLVTANVESGTVSVLQNRGDDGFGPKRSYRVVTETRSGPRSVAIGDLNADGKADLVTANDEVGTMSVLLNDGEGRFQTKRDYRTAASFVAIGDLSGDGKADLVAAADSKVVSVLLNRGDGSFGAKRNYRTGSGSSSVAIGDLNGDGKLDLATPNEYANPASVLLNRGDGSFAAKRDFRTGIEPVSVAIGDLNGDRKPDLATANDPELEAWTVSVLLNKGNGSFAAKRDYRAPDEPRSIAIGDLNGDGRPDLATGSDTTTAASVHANKGRGRFQAELEYATGVAPSSVVIGDLNGDGKPDLATANREVDTVSVLLNRPGLCTVQSVTGWRVPKARRTLARAHCRVGKIRRVLSGVERGRVIRQEPAFGAVLPGGSEVTLVVSRGRKPS